MNSSENFGSACRVAIIASLVIEGSWWPVWDEWVTQLDSDRVPAREPGGSKLTIIEDAPGSYVRVRSAA